MCQAQCQALEIWNQINHGRTKCCKKIHGMERKGKVVTSLGFGKKACEPGQGGEWREGRAGNSGLEEYHVLS